MGLKVASIILDGRFGGPQNRILQVGRRLKDYGIEPFVIIPKKNSENFYKKLQEAGVNHKRVGLHRLFTRDLKYVAVSLFWFIPEVINIAGILKREHIDVVHCNTIYQVTGVFAAKAAGKKVIMHLTGTWDRGMGYYVNKVMFTMFHPICDAFISSCERTRNEFAQIRKFKKKVEIIYPPVDLKRFDHSATKRALPRNIGEIIISTVSTINPTKGIENFISMAAELNKKYHNLTFYIIGPCHETQMDYLGHLKEQIRNLELGNDILFGGTDDVPGVLKSTDIFVCTSFNESGPMSVFEAMAMEKAIVSTDVGDLKKFIKNGESGYIVGTGDIAGLVEKVSFYIEYRELRKACGKKARQIAMNNFNLDFVVKKHKEIYSKTVQKID